jgi:hypothetical protein
MSTPKRNVVSFELPASMLEALQDDARMRGVKSFHKRASEIVMDYLTNRELNELRETVAELDRDVVHVGELVRRAAFSNIVHSAKMSPSVANEWIEQHMPSSL